jgi:Predicted ester cyclase
MADAPDIARDLIDAFNTADWERVRSLASPDIVYEEAGTGRRIQGMGDYLAMAQGWRQTFPDVTGQVQSLLSSGGTVAVEVTWTGTHTGPLVTPGAEIPATGKPISITSTLWYQIDGGQVQNLRHHLDVLGMLTQLGVMPA